MWGRQPSRTSATQENDAITVKQTLIDLADLHTRSVIEIGHPGGSDLTSELVLELFPRDFRKPLPRNPTREPLRLRVALAQIHRVEVVLVVQPRLDQLLHPEQRGRVQALELS